ncbi:P-loop containing nucleoside triphosphate hydrolase protein, partial [Ochromonadaceae sp. CCMP2298]
MEKKLFDFNDGFSRRFPFSLHFEDFDVAELGEIFRLECVQHDWPPAQGKVVQVAARRAARGRGNKGFGNAGAVRVLFEAAFRRALVRDRHAQSLQVQDVLGPRPDRANVPALGFALDELDAMVGLDAVKERVKQLANTAATNYDRELRGDPPYEVALNRVFVGNPGTGKTTVGRIYGKVLKALGLLSDGAWEHKLAGDLIGSAVGESEKRTSALVRRSMGKVLFIDEAYALNNSPYGRSALDVLVGLVHGAPGEDIAVVMAGYEKQMKKMFRESANPGLRSRFTGRMDFPDWDAADCVGRIAAQCEGDDLDLTPAARAHLLASLEEIRSRPGWANAR